MTHDTEIYTFLKVVYPFRDADDYLLRDLAKRCQIQKFGIGMTICKRGDKGELLYIVRKGEVCECLTDFEGEEIIVSVLNKGDSFGAESLLSDGNHLATTKAKTDVVLYVISKENLLSQIEDNSNLYIYLNKILKGKIDRIFRLFEKEKMRGVTHEKEISEKEKELAILTMASDLMKSESPFRVLEIIMKEIKNVMDVDMCCLFLLDSFSKELVLSAHSDKADEDALHAKMKVDEGITGWVVRNREPIVVKDIHSDPRVKFINAIDEEKLVSLLSVPLIDQNTAIGAVNLCTFYTREFTYKEVRVAGILASHIALAVSNSRLRRTVEAFSKTYSNNEKTGDFDRFVGETALLRKINAFIDFSSNNDEPIIIKGEEGTGKTLMVKLIHRKSLRNKGPLITVDCQLFEPESWGDELFGSKKSNGYIELADGGILFIRNIESLNKVNQLSLFTFLKEGTYTKVGEKKLWTSNVRIISSTSKDVDALVFEGRLNSDLMHLLGKTIFFMAPLRKRRRDIPIIADHIIEKLNRELHKNVKKLSNLAKERLISYDWPGNILELENVLRRAVLITPFDKILSEQIFFGIPRIEKKWEINLLSNKVIKKILIHKSFPALIQKIVGAVIIVSLLLLILGGGGLENSINILLWSFGWFFLFVLILFFGRIWCGICPFALFGDFCKKKISFEKKVPKGIVRYSPIMLLVSILIFLLTEGIFQVTSQPRYTAFIILTIPLGAAIFSVLFERHVWCRYLCPLGGIIGVYSLVSFAALRANRKICLSQCQTHECYLGGDEEGCPLFLHPYGLENNQHCTFCSNCIKNCRYKAIHIPLRIPFTSLPSSEASSYPLSILMLCLHGILLVENGSLLGMDSYLFSRITETITISPALMYIVLFFVASTLPVWVYYGLTMLFTHLPLSGIHRRLREIAFVFIPLSLMGHVAFFTEKLIYEPRHAAKGIEIFYDWLHIGEHWFGLGVILEVAAVLSGAAGSYYLLLTKVKGSEEKFITPDNIKGEKIFLLLLFFIPVFVILFL